MIPRFSLKRPTSLEEAFEAFTGADGDASYYAGGTELLQVMKMGLAQFDTLVDLKRIERLRGISVDDDGSLRIGAASTHREIERSAAVAERLPALVRLEQHVANVRVRNTGTLGGNLAFAEPHSDPATFLLACDAAIELIGPSGDRRVSVSDFVIGPLTTDREPDEIMLGVVVPAAEASEGRGYAKIAFFERPAASVAVRVTVRDDAIATATVAVGSMTEVPVLVPDAAEALTGAPIDATALREHLEAGRDLLGSTEVLDDLNGSADYKRHLAGVLLRRAVTDALSEAERHVV